MSKRALLIVIVGALIVGLVLSPSIIPVRATPSYVPGVTSGQWAKYKVLHDSCTFMDPTMCKSFGPGGFTGADFGLLQVMGVSGTSVTLSLTAVYANGTTSYQGLIVDVAAGTTNASGVAGSQGDYLLLAGGLTAPDPIWDSALAPPLNTTGSDTVLGASRVGNFLNHTISYSSPYGGFFFKSGFAFDQASGLFLDISISYSITGSNGGQVDFSIGMVDNDIWLTSPDFGLSANPTSIDIPLDGSGTSTITLTRLYGFSTGVALRATTSASGISCSLSSTLATSGHDASTLSCRGSPGAYTVIVKANASYLMRTVSVTMNIDPEFTISSSGGISFHSGASGTATITITARNGYSARTTLEITNIPSGLTCSLDSNNVSYGYGSVTLTCSGQPGSYTVTVKATGSGTSHSTDTPVTVSAAPASTQPASSLPMPLVYGGIGIALVVAALVAFLFLRRKPSGAVVAPGDASTPAVQR
jgi:hypothetical protein